MKKILSSAVLVALMLLTVGCEKIKTPAKSDIQSASSSVTASEQTSLEITVSSSNFTQSEREDSSEISSMPQNIEQSSQAAPSSSSSSNPAASPHFSNPAPQIKPTLQELSQGNSKKAQEIISNITHAGMTDIEKAKAVYLWLYPNFKYRGVSVDLSNGYTEQLTQELAAFYFKYRKGSCEHYAAAQKVLFKELGIESYYVIGERYSEISKRWGSHTWLMANVNGNMYHVDGLYGGLFYNKKEITFMVPDSALEKSHRWDRDTYVPCTQPQLLK